MECSYHIDFVDLGAALVDLALDPMPIEIGSKAVENVGTELELFPVLVIGSQDGLVMEF